MINKISKLYFQYHKDSIYIDAEYEDQYNIETSKVFRLFQVSIVDDYYLLVDLKKNKTIKVLKSLEQVKEYLSHYISGAEIVEIKTNLHVFEKKEPV